MRIEEPGEYAVLGLLAEEPRHGYALARLFAAGTELRQVVRLEMSQLYATLKKLEALGLISAQLDASSEGEGHRERRVYHLTSEGRQQFDDWVRAPVERPRDVRLMFLVKVYFALRCSSATALDLLAAQEAVLANFHTQLEAQLATRTAPAARPAGDAAPRFAVLVLRSRLRQTEAVQAWLVDVRAELARGNANEPPAPA
jgi:PadR family transcriptional regulator, regulatory protein AphA